MKITREQRDEGNARLDKSPSLQELHGVPGHKLVLCRAFDLSRLTISLPHTFRFAAHVEGVTNPRGSD